MKRKALTEKQSAFYQFLIKFFEGNERFPTMKDIADGMGFKSPNNCQEVLGQLVAKDYVVRGEKGRSASYKLTEYKAVLIKISQPEV